VDPIAGKVARPMPAFEAAVAFATVGPLDPQVREPLELLLATCDESLRGKRDRALLLFAWASGGRRRSEVSSARAECLTKSGDEYIYTLGVSKTNQEGVDRPENDKPIQGLLRPRWPRGSRKAAFWKDRSFAASARATGSAKCSPRQPCAIS
jgi:hypothetical protein